MFENATKLIIEMIYWLPNLIALYIMFDLIGNFFFGKR